MQTRINFFHCSLQILLLLNRNHFFEFFDLFLNKLLVGSSNLILNFIWNSMNCRLPDLLLVVSNICLLFTGRAHLACELNKVLESVFFVINIVAKLQAYISCRYIRDTLFNLGKIFPDLEWHALLQLFRVRLLLGIVPHMDFHCWVHFRIGTRFFEIDKSSLFTSRCL